MTQQPDVSHIPSQQSHTVFGSKSGWNDPPAKVTENTKPRENSVISHLKKKTVNKPTVASGFTPMQPTPGQYGAANPTQQMNGFPGFSQEQTRMMENQRVAKQAMESAAGPPPKDAIRSRLSSTSHSETETLQLSPEQEHMRTVFSSLIKNCKENPTLQAAFKRKLDDVEKRLETLYEKLKQGTLSMSVVTGLIKISQLAEQKQYQQAVEVHRQIVQSANFSQISAFMPGLKVLLQISFQLRV